MNKKTVSELAAYYADQFETKKRDNGENYTILKHPDRDKPAELYAAIYEAHADKLPDDFIFGMFADLLESIASYSLADLAALDDARHEIVDAQTSIYTSDLTGWLAADINNVYYLTQVLNEFEPKDGFQLLAMAQYQAIDEIMSTVSTFLADQYDAQDDQDDQ